MDGAPAGAVDAGYKAAGFEPMLFTQFTLRERDASLHTGDCDRH